MKLLCNFYNVEHLCNVNIFKNLPNHDSTNKEGKGLKRIISLTLFTITLESLMLIIGLSFFKYYVPRILNNDYTLNIF